MLVDLVSQQATFTIRANQVNRLALSPPMLLQTFSVWENTPFLLRWATLNFALDCQTATLPMLMPRFILKTSWAFVTSKVWTVQLLHSESIDTFTNIYLIPAARTSVTAFLPLCQAVCATKLVAIAALFWVLDNQHANFAVKVRIKRILSLVWA